MGLKGLLLRPPGHATASTTVLDAARIMSEGKLGAVPVLADGRLEGIFTYRDLVDRVVLAKRDPETATLAEVMTKNVDSLGVDASYGDALRTMVEHDYTYLPIVREDGRLAGLLSLRDLLEHRIDHLAAELDSISQYLAVDGPGGD